MKSDLTLDYILSQAVLHGACNTQLNRFRSALQSGNIELAWSIALGNATWLASRGITNIVELCKVSPTLLGISYQSNGNIMYKRTYNEGLLHGDYVWYYENGNIMYERTYNDGKLHGEHTEYYDNGNIWIKTTYNNNLLHGEYTSYYENGNIKVKTTYDNGVEQISVK